MAVWIYGWYTHVWSCLTNCEKTVRCDADLIDDSCEALKDLSNGVFRMSLSTFWGELWLFEYMGVIYTCVSCLTNCEKTVRCDADLIDDSCEALKDLSNGVFRMSLSTFWGELWLFEYMGDIHMCGVASLIVRKLWGVTQIWLMILVRLWKTFRTAFSVCLYRLFEVSYGCLNIWLYTHVWVASLIVRKLWGVTQIWLMILVRLWKTFRTAFSVCLYRLFEVSYGCLNIWWYTHVWSCLTNCEKTVRCDADLIDDSCEALKDLSNGVFRMSLSTFWGELWLFEYMGDIHMCELPH